MASPQVLERIRSEIIDSGRDTRYLPGGYEFVLNGLDFFLTRIGEKRHVTGQELSIGLLSFAHKQYGLLAHDVMIHLGIKKSDDFGYIVYNLIEIGVMSKRPEDKIEDFFDVVDFSAFFLKQDYHVIDKEFIKRIKGA